MKTEESKTDNWPYFYRRCVVGGGYGKRTERDNYEKVRRDMTRGYLVNSLCRMQRGGQPLLMSCEWESGDGVCILITGNTQREEARDVSWIFYR